MKCDGEGKGKKDGRKSKYDQIVSNTCMKMSQ